jgi:hypothetical protein
MRSMFILISADAAIVSVDALNSLVLVRLFYLRMDWLKRIDRAVLAIA